MRARRLVVLATVVLVPAACALDEVGTEPLGPGTPRAVVHAVLDPSRYSQILLLEEMLTGRESVTVEARFDTLDIVRSGGGVPISGARVVVTSLDGGDSAVLGEEISRVGGGRGAGMYRFVNATADDGDTALALDFGGRYSLRIETQDGRVITGETRIPAPGGVAVAPILAQFNRDVDSFFVTWDEVPAAARFEIRIDAPRGPFSQFVDSTEYLVSGTLRNPALRELPHVFLPGFQQALAVFAVDSNYWGYYRTRGDTLSGRGRIERLRGGSGVFGAAVPIRRRLLHVRAEVDHGIEGRWSGGGAGGVPAAFNLYEESELGGVIRLSGGYTLPGGANAGIVGELSGTRVTLAFLRSQSLRDTAVAIQGIFAQLTINGYVIGQAGQTVRWVK